MFGPPGLHTTAENSKCAHVSAPALPPKNQNLYTTTKTLTLAKVGFDPRNSSPTTSLVGGTAPAPPEDAPSLTLQIRQPNGPSPPQLRQLLILRRSHASQHVPGTGKTKFGQTKCGTINTVHVSVKASPAAAYVRLSFQRAFMWSIAG